MIEVESESWKEFSGTSITHPDEQEKFYRIFAKYAIANGWLCGHFLEVKGEPIAYIYGVNFNGIFSSLKVSYKVRFKAYGPENLIRMYTLQELYKQRVRINDFTGVCEEHKMRWANKTYGRTTYRLFNRTLKGVSLQAISKIRQWESSLSQK